MGRYESAMPAVPRAGEDLEANQSTLPGLLMLTSMLRHGGAG
jgi:hypothetical protein